MPTTLDSEGPAPATSGCVCVWQPARTRGPPVGLWPPNRLEHKAVNPLQNWRVIVMMVMMEAPPLRGSTANLQIH